MTKNVSQFIIKAPDITIDHMKIRRLFQAIESKKLITQRITIVI